MGYLIPIGELTVAEVMDLDKALETELLQLAAKQTGIGTAELVAREIMPKTDLGLTNEEWLVSYTAAYTWERKVNVTLAKNKFVGFLGAANNAATPKTLAARFATPAKQVDVWHYEKLYPYRDPVGVALVPIIFVGGKTMEVWFYGKATGDDYPVLRGKVVEPLGEYISPGESRKP